MIKDNKLLDILTVNQFKIYKAHRDKMQKELQKAKKLEGATQPVKMLR